LNVIPENSRKDSFIRLVQLGGTSEYIARHCINRYLLNPHMWDHFATDESIKMFWSKSEKEKRTIWGKKLDISEESIGFDRNRVHYQEND